MFTEDFYDRSENHRRLRQRVWQAHHNDASQVSPFHST